MVRHMPDQTPVWEIDTYIMYMYNQWATAPGRSLNNPRPDSTTHLCNSVKTVSM